MKKLPANERAVKRTSSFPPELWGWTESYAKANRMKLSSVIQEAVELLRSTYEEAEKTDQALKMESDKHKGNPVNSVKKRTKHPAK